MTVTVVPLDPASPMGIEVAARLTAVLGRIQAAIWARQAAEPQPAPQTPPRVPPSSPPRQPDRPSGPRQPTRGRHTRRDVAA